MSSSDDRDINSNHINDGKASATKNYPSTHNNIQRNVMVLSWLTASNNNGRFLFSIHETRYSSQLLAPWREDGSYKTSVEFSLSVPVKGMEDIVKDVGSISGRWCSKLQSDAATSLVEDGFLLSNRQRKMQKKDNIKSNGILGLIPVPIGNCSSLEKSDLFAIQGTVAHLRCRTYAVIGPPRSSGNLDATNFENTSNNTNCSTQPLIDDDHLLIMGEVIDAYVHPSYWDPKKLLFRPIKDEGEQTVPPPYLTFFGSQTFGYVVSSIDDDDR
jgi:hypothetical protein